ncbi:MAG: hypothetical protein WC604_02580 [Candidatus Gracilibacteria bacterium]
MDGSEDFFLSEFVCAVASNDSCDPTKIGIADPTSPIGKALMGALEPRVAKIFADNGDKPSE